MAVRTPKLESIQAGTPILFGGNRLAFVNDELAAAFSAGGELHVNSQTGELLHIGMEAVGFGMACR